VQKFFLSAQAITFGFGACASFSGIQESTAAPVIPGLHHNHPLNEAEHGALLIEELRCASCHEGVAPGSAPSAPNLTEVGSRLNPVFLRNYLANPAAHDPGTAMPNVLGNRTEEEKTELAASLSAYLLSLGKDEAPATDFSEEDSKNGNKLFHQVGCIACHSPRDVEGKDTAHSGSIGLDHTGKKYQPGGLVSFLHEPLKVRPAGRMPDMRLSRSESELISAFLLESTEKGIKEDALATTPEQITAGKTAFTELNCIACHQVEDAGDNPPLAAPRAELDLNKGCLSKSPGAAPDYSLSDEQRGAIRTALAEKPKQPSPANAIKNRLTALNCISCHQRDDYGGVSLELDGYFHSTQEALGNESRIPPQLTLSGAKLRPDWMNKVFYEGESVRPYMTTRMPQYGTEAMAGLTELFGKTDKLDPFEFAELDKESAPMMRDGGHKLVGDTGLNCIACHNYNGNDSPGMQGLDLMTSYQRLQPAWFNQFMRTPGALRPGIIMPSFWPAGKAIQTEILNGNTEDQIRALWFNFSLGRSARDPSGLKADDPKLLVADKVITYRGRSNVAGYRGIAVGFPGGLSYAFNAQNGAFSAIWKGEFVNVGWRGQGSGNFNPLAPAIQLAQDVAFLPEPTDPWPLHPVRSKEVPVNPDPLYPRQYGYGFQGYSLGENGVPTFRYLSGEVAIQDSSVAISDKTPSILRRTLTFDAPQATRLYFRALTGKIEEASATKFHTSDVGFTLIEGTTKTSTTLRKAADETSENELIITLDLPAGTSTQTIEYVLRR